MTKYPSVSCAGQNVLITGANTGIGYTTARGMLTAGARVFLACRNSVLAAQAAKSLHAETGGEIVTLPLDLADLDSVRECAQSFSALGLPLHVLINNAGVAGSKGLTRSGFELSFGTCHVGHFLLTMQLMPHLLAAPSARVVTVSSQAHYSARRLHWERLREKTRSLTALPEYAAAKLANALFSAELARRVQGTGITTYALHPGAVASDVWRSVPQPFRWLMTRAMISPERGAATSLHCATSSAAAVQTGLYYENSKLKTASKLARDPALAAELWKRSVEWTGADLPPRATQATAQYQS